MDPPGTTSQRDVSQGKSLANADIVATATLVREDVISNSSVRSSASMATSLYQQQVASGAVGELTYKNQVLSSRHVLVQPIVSTNDDLLLVPLKDPSEYIDNSSTENIRNSSSTLTEKDSIVQSLVQTLHFPEGLAERLYDSTRQTFTHHFWIIDNSGSMLSTDCMRIVQQDVMDLGGSNKPPKKVDLVKCSRWNELEATILAQAQLSGILQAPTTFRFLNPTPGAPHEFTVRNHDDDWAAAQAAVRQTRPEGVTPLLAELELLHDRIAKMADEMRQAGQRAVVVIATDGLPSDEYGESSPKVQEAFAQALKQLQLLPVWIVMRLFTNEHNVVSYYRKLDKKLELPMECISNFLTESREIHRCNPWLNYALPLHQCREMGFHHRVFDLLDERPLTKDDLCEFLQVFFGSQPFHNAPNVHTEWKDFLSFLKMAVGGLHQQWSPHSKKMEDWIDVKKLAMEHGLRGSIRQRVSQSLPGGWD